MVGEFLLREMLARGYSVRALARTPAKLDEYSSRITIVQGDARDPRASPLFAPLDGLPPLLLQVGERETVLRDSTEFAARAQAAGVAAQCQVWPGMVHVFQQFPTQLAAARRARQQLGEFLRAQFARTPQEP